MDYKGIQVSKRVNFPRKGFSLGETYKKRGFSSFGGKCLKRRLLEELGEVREKR